MLREIIERGWKATFFFFLPVIPNITRVLVAFTSCFNLEEMDLAGRFPATWETIVVISFWQEEKKV